MQPCGRPRLAERLAECVGNGNGLSLAEKMLIGLEPKPGPTKPRGTWLSLTDQLEALLRAESSEWQRLEGIRWVDEPPPRPRSRDAER
jgi:hypothetical protein